MRGLTSKQQDILSFIEEFHRRQGIPPTVYEVAERFQIKPSTSFAHLRALQRKGYLDRTSKARSITLLKRVTVPDPGQLLLVPIVGKISAGLPLLAEQNVEDSLRIDPAMLPWGIGSAPLFALRVSGLSMRDAGILDGDVVIAKQSATASQGQIAIVLVDGESTIKYFYAEPGRIELRPANPVFKSRYYPPDSVTIQGVMVGLLRTC